MRKSVQFLLLFLMCISASWTWASDAPERTVLFNMGDYDSQYWRIPALVTAADNSLVAVVDKRGSSLGDLPNTISIMSRRSTDNGKNWSEPVVVAQGGNGKTYGDPAVVLDKKTGNLICMFVGDQGLWNATPYNRQGIYVSKSTDNGVSWSEPVAITDQVYANHSSWYAGFAGSGHGLCLKDGRLMFWRFVPLLLPGFLFIIMLSIPMMEAIIGLYRPMQLRLRETRPKWWNLKTGIF